MSKSREQLLPDIRKALDDVYLFIVKADQSRQRKPGAPTAADIEAYCKDQQRKIDLLMEEAKTLREAGDNKVLWTDIDGNSSTDAAWLKRKVGF